MKLFILTALLSLTSILCYAHTDTITIRHKSMSTQLFIKGKQMDLKGLKKYVQDDALAQKEYNTGMGSTVFAFIFGFAGGSVVGYDFGYAVAASRDIHPATIVAGLAVAAISVPFSINAQKHYRRSAELYNRSRRKTTGLSPGNELRLVGTGNGFGVQYSFR